MILSGETEVFAEKPVPVSKAAFCCYRTATNRLIHLTALTSLIEIQFV